MGKKEQGSAEPSFEKALAELESIVATMEDGGLSLEQSLAAHKRGLELAKQCRERLNAAQQQVRVLEGEVQDVHPHDGSPQRGVMIEVELREPNAAEDRILFASHKPLWLL